MKNTPNPSSACCTHGREHARAFSSLFVAVVEGGQQLLHQQPWIRTCQECATSRRAYLAGALGLGARVGCILGGQVAKESPQPQRTRMARASARCTWYVVVIVDVLTLTRMPVPKRLRTPVTMDWKNIPRKKNVT